MTLIMKPLPPLTLTSQISLGVLVLATMIGLVHGIAEIHHLATLRQQQPFVFAGKSLEGIRDLIRDEKYVGFISDRDMNDKNISAQFAQYQLALAPTILELNNPRHRFLILDLQDPRHAAMVLTQTQARPLRKNNLGIIIAERMRP